MGYHCVVGLARGTYMEPHCVVGMTSGVGGRGVSVSSIKR